MKVLAISHSAVAGPYREKWRLLSKRKGWDLTLVVPERWPEGGAMLEAAAAPFKGIQHGVLGLRLAGRVGFFTYIGLPDLIAELKPDLIYCEEEPYSLAAFQAARAAKRCGAAFVFFSWENIRRTFKPPLNWVRRKVSSMSAGAVAGNTEGMALYRNWGFGGPMAQIPQYGVDARAFEPARAPKGRFKAGYVGRLTPEKGPDLFIRGCAMSGVPGIIVGRGPQEAELKALAAKLAVSIEFRPFVPFEKRHQIYRDFDVLVLPSRTTPRWKEQFGRVIIEAGACGLPTVGSDSGAISEVVGKAGMIFSEGKSEELGSCLLQLKKDAALRSKLGRLARARALEYGEVKLAAKLGKFLESVLAAKR